MQHANNLATRPGLSALISFLKRENYQFVTPTPATHHRNNQRPENKRTLSLADAFGWSRPFKRSLIPEPLFELLTDSAILSECAAGWKSSVRASTLDGDLFLHSAFPTNSADAVFFGPDTYRFARAIKHNLSSEPRQLGRALDLGCGSGAGGVVVAKNALCREVVLTDINDTALQMSRLNAEAAGLISVATIQSDLFANVDGDFDMIVANPPYLNDPLQRAYRHGGGELGSELSCRIAQSAIDRLLPGGTLLLYTGSPIVGGVDRLLQAVQQDLAGCDMPWSYEEIDPDVFGEELETSPYSAVDRIAAVVLTVRKPGVSLC
jgi:methylase of polypeptide subunit release factors